MHAIAHAQPTRAPDVQQQQRPPHRLNLMVQRKAAPQALPPKPAGRCACGGGCPACQARLQAKLVIGPVNDPLEREADHIAGLVTTPGATTSLIQPSSASGCPLQRACACGGSCGCGKKPEEDETLQRQASGNGTPDRVPALVDSVLMTGGAPLPESTRSEFEPRFGQDFSRVRVHADPVAAQSAAAVQALAYTVGRDIVFGAGQFAPESASGRRLIAHELTHVVQQGAAANTVRSASPSIQPSVSSGGPAISRQAGPGGVIQRQPAPEHRTSPISSGVPSEKWREDAESAYRRAGLSVAANAVRNCREWGDCQRLLTIQEAWNAYKTGRITANLGAPPETGPGKSAVNGGVALAGVAATPLLAEGGAAAAKTLAERRLLAWGVAETVPLLVPEAAAATTAAPAAVAAPAAGVATVAVPIAVGVVLVLAVIDLVGWARFQGKLESLGYFILPDPLATCIQNCHTAPARTPQPKWDPDLFPRRDPFGPIDPEIIKEWLDKSAPKPAPKPTPTPTPTPTPVPVPKPEPEKKRRRKCRWEPCESPLPITWPMALPLPYTSPRRLTRQNAGDREWEGIERGAPQRRMAEEIRRARERLVPPPNPCFTHDAEPNAPYDAHHTHPLYLGGEEADYNLCALRADRHQLGHPSLDNQTEHLEEYMECGVCSGFLSQHPPGQDYVIVGRK